MPADSSAVATQPADLIDMYRQMLAIRRFEERSVELVRAGEIPGPLHPYIGQEAIAVGVCATLNAGDHVTSTHRGHGHCLAKGADMRLMFAELMGKATGYCRGKGGSMHVADFGIGMLGANGIVGAGLSIAAGAALSSVLRGEHTVAVGFFGDGAVGAGSFHEAMNLSSLWQLPVIWICESNGWQSGNQTSIGMAAGGVAALGEANRIPSRQIDGNDVAVVVSAAYEAVDRARAGGGPSLIDAVTYRLDGHSIRENSPADSRPGALLDPWRGKDPILRAEAALLDQKLADNGTIQQLRSLVAAEVEDAIEFARSSPEPSPESALEDVFTEEIRVAP